MTGGMVDPGTIVRWIGRTDIETQRVEQPELFANPPPLQEPIMNSPVEKTEPVSYRWTEGDYGEWKFANCAPDDGADLENFEPLYSASTVEALIEEVYNRTLAYATATAENAALLSRVERMEKALKPFAEASVVYDGHSSDDPIWVALHQGSQIRITFGDLRKARSALQEKMP
jgi:hypothetical protein